MLILASVLRMTLPGMGSGSCKKHYNLLVSCNIGSDIKFCGVGISRAPAEAGGALCSVPRVRVMRSLRDTRHSKAGHSSMLSIVCFPWLSRQPRGPAPASDRGLA